MPWPCCWPWRPCIVLFDRFWVSQLFELPNHPETLPKIFWGGNLDTSDVDKLDLICCSTISFWIFEVVGSLSALVLVKVPGNSRRFFLEQTFCNKTVAFTVRHSLPESRHSQMQLKPRESPSSAKTRNYLTWPVAVIFVWIFGFFLRFVLTESTWKILQIFLEQTSCTKTVVFAVRYSAPEFRHW